MCNQIKNRIYVDKGCFSLSSDSILWIQKHGINKIIAVHNICSKSLQDRDPLVVQHNGRVSVCNFELSTLVYMPEVAGNGIDVLQTPTAGKIIARLFNWSVSQKAALQFVEA